MKEATYARVVMDQKWSGNLSIGLVHDSCISNLRFSIRAFDQKKVTFRSQMSRLFELSLLYLM